MTFKRLLLGALVPTLTGAAATALAITAGPVRPTTAPSAAPAPRATQAASGGAATASAPHLSPAESAFFESKIRPIFVNSCYKCHSPQQGKVKGGLILDNREAMLRGGDNGIVLVPGDPAHSRLITAVEYHDSDLQMPPKGQKLAPAQIADLNAWVKMGAPDPRVATPGAPKLTGLNDKARAHWSYQPVTHPTPPEVKDKAWVKTPVDAFILKKLETAGLTPSAPASRETLIRRATYDLIGLPPTPEEVQAFISDRSPNAWEKVIDRLLASPHYGERWGRYWLDSARYSDTTGSDQQNIDYRLEYAWTYRDWVINALNSDMPYDRFLTEQIAADLQPDAAKHPNDLAALGFITDGKRFPNVNDTIDERIDTLSKATMALTVSCARCHDHKFDPIPQSDYYSLHGIFSSIVEPENKPLVGAPPLPAEKAEFEKKLAALDQQNREVYYKEVSAQSSEFQKKAAGYLLASFYSVGPFRDSAKRLAAVREFNLDAKGNGQLLNVARVMQPGSPVFAPFQWFARLPKDQFNARAGEVLKRIERGEMSPAEITAANRFKNRLSKNGKRYFEPIKGDLTHVNPLVVAAFKDVSPSSLHEIEDVAAIYGKFFASLEPRTHAYVEAARHASGETVPGFDAGEVQAIQTPFPIDPTSALTEDRLHELSTALALGNGAYGKFQFSEINELILTDPGAPGRAMIVADSDHPHDSPIFIRGDQQNRGPIAPREFLQILAGPHPKPYTIGSGRFELARDIASRNNPLTARVLVNRVWMHHFGRGIVPTPDDLGVQSEPPSHPQLLDYLANRFMDEGWSIKKLHKLIMMSSVYQQTSDTNPTYARIDPNDTLLWRANLRRLDFEAIRDTLLMFTGKMNLAIGGKSVNLTDEPYSNRRSVYGYVDRGRLPELMSQFDFADPNRPNSRRTSTIVPQQALFFMNSPMSADVARKVCSRPEFVSAKDDYARVRALYEVLYQRPPKPGEVEMAKQFYNETVESGQAKAAEDDRPVRRKDFQRRIFGKASANGRAAIQNWGVAVERTPLTVWQLYAQALLFTNEVAYVN